MMNKRFYILSGVLVVLIAVVIILMTRQSQANTPPPTPNGWNATDPQTLMIPRWFLNTLVVDGKEVELGDKLLNLQFEEGSKANGEGGCNSFFADYQVSSDGKLSFGPIGSTKMACEPGMDLETAYFDALSRVQQFRTEQGKLTLSSTDGKTTLIYNMPPK
jgi:heat shock protein HslJ